MGNVTKNCYTVQVQMAFLQYQQCACVYADIQYQLASGSCVTKSPFQF